MLAPAAPIVAIVYGEGEPVDPVLQAVTDHAAAQGLRLAGFVQRDVARPGRRRCDMVLRDLTSGDAILISEDRGEASRGCRLNVAELLRAMGLARAALDDAPDLLVANKFGRTEAEGGGIRPLVAEALERGVPVLVAVPERNLDAWRDFAGELSVSHRFDPGTANAADVADLLGLDGTPLRLDLAGAAMDEAMRVAQACR